MGWERPIWFADNAATPENDYSYGRQNWFPNVAAECRAVRETVGIFDQTSFSKFLMQGRHAESVMKTLCANDVGVAPGRTVYTGMLNPSGGYESDVTVTRLAEEEFLIVSGSAQAIRDFDWMSRHVPPDADAYLTDVTSAYAVLGVMGPKSRDLLSRVCKTDFSNEAFPFATMQEIDIAHAPIWAVRITYVGELGWELYMPAEFGAAVYEAIESVGADLGLRDAGYYAMESLRLEKGYRAWSHELSPLRAAKADEPSRRLVMFTIDDPDPVLWGGEMILRDGEPIGDIRSGAYGHTLGRAVGSGFVKREPGQNNTEMLSGRFQIEIAGERFDATPQLQAPYDPKSKKVRQ
jgi:4-methylaminobutanoate oxidase (formaldehyde-forming)